MPEAYIVAAARTAGGKRKGHLSDHHPTDLAGAVIAELVTRAGAAPDQIEDVILGCVTQAGQQSSNVARWAALSAGLPESVPGVSIDRQCGSSQQALHFAAAMVMSGQMDCVIAGGVESMTRVPMGLASDHMAANGLGTHKGKACEERYPGIVFNQFEGADAIARKHGLTREELDAFALESHRRAAAATRSGRFDDEILPIKIEPRDGAPQEHRVDEGIRFDASMEAMAGRDPILEGGLTTAATASQICDGASGVLIVNESGLKALGVQPVARIHAMYVSGGDPVIMLEEPLFSTDRLLAKIGMVINDFDLFEVNEAFAPIPLAWARHVGADIEKLNVNGGAISLGHPLGATGTRLVTTLVHELGKRGGRYGLQTMCEGGGMANVTIIERL